MKNFGNTFVFSHSEISISLIWKEENAKKREKGYLQESLDVTNNFISVMPA